MKKSLSIILSLLMIISCVSAIPFEALANELTTGQCGENVTYSFDEETGTLTISGEGDMYDYEELSPFDSCVYGSPGIENDIVSVIIEDGVTNIGSTMFYCCINLESATIPNSVTKIGNSAFGGCRSLTDIYYSGTEEEWYLIDIEINNGGLNNTTIHCTDGDIVYEIPDEPDELDEPDEPDEPTSVSLGTINVGETKPVTVENGGTRYYYTSVSLGTINVGETKPVTVENGGARYYYTFTPAADSEFIFTSDSSGDTYGSVYTVSEDGEWQEVASDDDSGNGSNFRIDFEGDSGSTYILESKFYSSDKTGSFNVTLTENTVKAITFVPAKPYELIENKDGYWSYYRDWDEENDEEIKVDYFYYDKTNIYQAGYKLIVEYKNGNNDEYICTEDRYDYVFVNSTGDVIYPEQYDDQRNNPWTLGSNNYFTVEYSGKTTQVPVTIVENPIASIDFSPVKPITYIENYGGYEEDDYFHYDTYQFNEGDKLTVNYKTGKTVVYTYTEKHQLPGVEWTWDKFFDEDGNMSEDYPNVYSDQNDKHWTVGGENYFTITYQGVSTTVPVTIIENPVESIEFELASPIVLYENQGGYYVIEINGNEYDIHKDENGYYYYGYNEETGEDVRIEADINSNNVFFFYDRIPVYKNGNRLIVHYKNGTTKILSHRFLWNDEREGYYFVDESGEPDEWDVKFNWTITKDSQFTIGSNNFVTVSYLNNKTQIPVTVVENNIDHIEFVTLQPVVFNQDDDNDYHDYGYDEFEYNWSKLLATGNQLKVFFNDSTSKTYTIYTRTYNFAKKLSVEPWGEYWLVDETGGVIIYSAFDFDYDYRRKWQPGEAFDVTISYLGASTMVPVTITSNEISHAHSYTTHTVVPTCTKKGYTTHTCECGDSYVDVDSYVDALGHDFGANEKTCKRCGAVNPNYKAPQKKANTLSVKGKTVKVKFAKLKKKKQTIAINKAMTVSNAQGAVTYAKASGNKKITVAKNGKITVKKGLKKGSYKVKIKVTAAGNDEYNAAVKTVTVTIKVK